MPSKVDISSHLNLEENVVKTIGTLATETINRDWTNLDRMNTDQIISIMLDENAHMVECLRQQKDIIANVVDRISTQYLCGGRIIYAGAGTSGRMGVMDAAECPPTFGISGDSIKGIIAGGYDAMISAAEWIEDSEDQGKADIEALGFQEKDILVAISASGRTPYCLGAIKKARSVSALTVAVCCNRDSEMGAAAELAIEIETGPEVIAGSTRLKAASAQKAVLNMISTITMIRAGKIYRNLMVDMKATNEKLMDRSVRIFQAATGIVDCNLAKSMIQKADGNLKTAIVMSKCHVNAMEAAELLKKNNHFVHAAITVGDKNTDI